MTHPKHIEPGVTQADREAAEALAEWAFPEGLRDAAIVDIAEDFACHRTAVEAASRAREDALREALQWIVALCPEQTGDLSSGALAGLLYNIEQHARAALNPAAKGGDHG